MRYEIPLLIMVLIFMMSPVSACATVIINDDSASDIVGYRRDAVDQANLTITHFNGGLVESKPGFVHSIILDDGWSVTIGGNDGPICNSLLQLVGYTAHMLNSTSVGYLAVPIMFVQGMGHFTIKDASGNVFYAVYNEHWKVGNIQLQPGQFICTPNDPNLVQVGFSSSASDVLNADPWGVNRRNIIVYDDGGISIEPSSYSTPECMENPDIVSEV